MRPFGNSWRSAAATGMPWTTSPSDPRRTMRKLFNGSAGNARQQVARRMILGVADNRRPAAVADDDVALGHGLDGVVGPLAVHVGPKRGEQRARARFRKYDDVVDAAERGHQLRPVAR